MADVGAQPAPKEDKGPHGPGEGGGGAAVGPEPGRQVRRCAVFRDGVDHLPGDEGKGDVHKGHHHSAGAESPDPSAIGPGIAPELAPEVPRQPFRQRIVGVEGVVVSAAHGA